MIDNIAENVLKDGKDGIKQNMLKIFDEFIDEYADEMWQVVNEFIKLKSENAELKHRAEVIEKDTARECLKILHSIGGCDATEEWSKGWDAAIDEAYKELSDKYGVTAFDEEDGE